MILPYYKIEQTEEGKQFFYDNAGYFNFWDKYLIMNIPDGEGKVFSVLVNRPNTKFSGKAVMTEECKIVAYSYVAESVRVKKPEEMFEDFPELDK